MKKSEMKFIGHNVIDKKYYFSLNEKDNQNDHDVFDSLEEAKEEAQKQNITNPKFWAIVKTQLGFMKQLVS